MAIPLIPGITYTMGGIVVDAHAQVLDEKGAAIPGLFAAGATTGGLEGGSRAAYIGGLIKAGTFGLLAAERVAELTGKNQATRASSTTSAAAPRGLARYPVLDATVRYGRLVILGGAICLAAVLITLSWGPFGVAGIVVSLLATGLLVAIGLGYIELIQLITEFLMPSEGDTR
jgi:fumarate reductase flavoprotein subunit